MTDARRARRLAALATLLLTGLGASFAVMVLWPQLQVLVFIVACGIAIVVMAGVHRVAGRRAVLGCAVPAIAVAVIGTLMLADDVALTRSGVVTEVVIVDHSFEKKRVRDRSGHRTVYTHTYALETVHGAPVAQPMVYRGPTGFEGLEVGDSITVLIDPAGAADTRPATEVDPGRDIGILTVGLVATAGVFAWSLIAARRRREPEEDASSGVRG